MADSITGGIVIPIIIACGCMFSISIYLLLDPNIVRKVVAIMLFGSSINISILVAGRLNNDLPSFVEAMPLEAVANPLPQALILTAIVISFGILIFLTTFFKYILKKHGDD
jgi:multicomponent Na+:H+ antiporter subunit C